MAVTEPGRAHRAEIDQVRIAEQLSCDVLVVGGGLAGIFAALGARRCGAATTLVEAGGCVGGQATLGGVHTFCGDTENVNDDWSSLMKLLGSFDGGVGPFVPNQDGRPFSAEHLKFAAQDMLERAGVMTLLHTAVFSARRDGGRVVSVLGAGPGGTIRMTARQYVDSTGDADLVHAGGWDTTYGGASLGPDRDGRLRRIGGRLRLPMSLYFALVDTGHEVVPSLPLNGPTWQSDEELPMTTVYEMEGFVLVKMKVIGFNATDTLSLSQAEQAGRRAALALVYHLQTKGYRGIRYRRHRLAWMAPNIGIREGRRIQAERPLTTEDLLTGAAFDDAVGVGSYHIDYHWPNDPRRAGTGVTTQVAPYQIPLRAMRPQGASNLVVPGRCMGGDQLAMSSFRVMATCAQTGFAAGSAAGMAISHGCTLDELRIDALQKHLRDAGVRLDRAPYMSYLRAHRTLCGRVAARDLRSVDIAFAPDGSVVLAIAEPERLRVVACAPGGAPRTVIELPEQADAVAVSVDETRVLPQSGVTVAETEELRAILIWENGSGAQAVRVDLAGGAWELAEVGRGRAHPRTHLELSTELWAPSGTLGPPLIVALVETALTVSGPASHRVDIRDHPGPAVGALAPTAGGVLVALGYSDTVSFQHIPYDHLLNGTAALLDDDHARAPEWLELVHEAGDRS